MRFTAELGNQIHCQCNAVTVDDLSLKHDVRYKEDSKHLNIAMFAIIIKRHKGY